MCYTKLDCLCKNDEIDGKVDKNTVVMLFFMMIFTKKTPFFRK